MAKSEYELQIGVESAEQTQPACVVRHYNYQHPNSEGLALKDINFTLEPGDTLAIMGDSGSGKSTLVHSLLGLGHHFYKGQSSGEVRIFGKDVRETDIMRLTPDYGVVFQDFRNLLFASKVQEAIAFPMENQALPREQMEAKVSSLMNRFGITDIADRDATHLSGGQGQKVVMAAMLAKEPKLMVLDDIASDLDPQGQQWTKDTIKQLKEQGVTVVVVDPSCPKWLLEEGADKVLVLDKGQQVYFGDPKGVLTNPEMALKVGALTPTVEFRESHHSPDAVVVDGVSFAYTHDKLAVDDVTLAIKKGAITGLIGPNGSGKTTLAKMIAGLYQPMHGTINIEGQNVSGLPAKEMVKRVSYLHQNPGDTFFKETVREMVEYTPKALGIESTVDLDWLGINDLKDKDPNFLSGGQKQRVALAVALSANSDILVLDEPTTGLNQRERLELVDTVVKLQDQGKTILIISHDWDMIGRATERIIAMIDGEIARYGDTKDVLRDKELFAELNITQAERKGGNQ